VELYFNRRDVQDALHANVSGALPGPWATCTSAIDYSRDDLLASMLPVYEDLLRSGISMLVYTGDVDAIVPIIGSRRWIEGLGLQVEEPWRAWRAATGQVGGWTTGYGQGLRFASVRGAGHLVPLTQPERAFHLFSRWIHGKPL
jgi:serine carboxypeptidase-like clade 2